MVRTRLPAPGSVLIKLRQARAAKSQAKSTSENLVSDLASPQLWRIEACRERKRRLERSKPAQGFARKARKRWASEGYKKITENVLPISGGRGKAPEIQHSLNLVHLDEL